jgi:ADP-heptose:LPS heptosyltransferase
MSIEGSPRILVIRRDNIGDLVCTTPLIAALRQRFPEGYIAALVNSYNRDVLASSPRLDAVFAYTKAKHRAEGETLLGAYVNRVRLFLALRRLRFDYAVLAGPHFQPHALRFARAAGARQIVGFIDDPSQGGIDLAVPYGAGGSLHEAEDVFRLGAPLGVIGEPSRTEVFADAARVAQVRDALMAMPPGPSIAVHISARKPSQRWAVENFGAAMRALHQLCGARFILLWAPGDEANPRHPGDDGKAQALLAGLSGVPVLAWPTAQLPELMAALAVSDVVLCADGGAMHLATALGKPIACLFGDSSPARWRPWGVPHAVLQATSRNVADVPAGEAVAAVRSLLATA